MIWEKSSSLNCHEDNITSLENVHRWIVLSLAIVVPGQNVHRWIWQCCHVNVCGSESSSLNAHVHVSTCVHVGKRVIAEQPHKKGSSLNCHVHMGFFFSVHRWMSLNITFHSLPYIRGVVLQRITASYVTRNRIILSYGAQLPDDLEGSWSSCVTHSYG